MRDDEGRWWEEVDGGVLVDGGIRPWMVILVVLVVVDGSKGLGFSFRVAVDEVEEEDEEMVGLGCEVPLVLPLAVEDVVDEDDEVVETLEVTEETIERSTVRKESISLRRKGERENGAGMEGRHWQGEVLLFSGNMSRSMSEIILSKSA